MDSQGLPDNSGGSGSGSFKPDDARKILFEKILDQLADSGLFSSGLSSTIFIIYAHNNEKEGTAYDECVRDLITWLDRIHARILSDQSPLPPHAPRLEGTEAIGNILANQICLLPCSSDCAETPTRTSVEKVIVCGSEVLERYCGNRSAQAYMKDIIQICTERAKQPTASLISAIRARVETECGKSSFHHVLTELAFLAVRKSSLLEQHGMIPVALSQMNGDDAPMQYLPIFWNTDVKLKLKSPGTESLHKLYFKLLQRLFLDERAFIESFRECYKLAVEDLELDDGAVVAQERFDHIVNHCITKAHQRYWKLCCVTGRDGKLEVYTGKLSDQISQVLENVNQSTQQLLLQWLSPTPTSKDHGKYHDLGTSRMEGTCDWVIRDEEFRRWYACESSALLFLSGRMGTGKTYSTSRVIDWVEKGLETSANDEAFAYFYCNKQDPARSEPKAIVRNIIRQLATGPWKNVARNTTVHKTVHALYLKDNGRGILSTFAQWEACLLELIDTYPRTTIVLDALDECNMEQREGLIHLLVKLANRDMHATPVKIFVAARPEDEIRQHLGKDHFILMQDQHNAADIEKFVRKEISKHRRWFKMPPDFQNEVVVALLKKSGDMFLFASLQIQRLLNCDTQIAMRKRLRTLPDSLKTTYEDILQNAASDPDERKLLDRALQWVMCSARPLTSRELLFAVSQDWECDKVEAQIQDLDEDLMLKWTRNLLHLDGRSTSRYSHGFSHGEQDDNGCTPRVWRLAHQAVAEFLEDSSCYNSGSAHCEAGTVCLMIMLDAFGADPAKPRTDSHEITDLFNWCDSHGYDEEKYLKLRITLAKWDRLILLTYAVYAWPTHVRAQEGREGPNVDELSRRLLDFLGRPEKGTRVYDIWLQRVQVYAIPDWSIFWERSIRHDSHGQTIMAPIFLACHLGIYTCLLDWWRSSSFDHIPSLHLPEWSPLRTLDLDRCGFSGQRWTLVVLACVHGETKIIKQLLGGRVQMNIEDNIHGVSPFIAAVLVNSVETMKALIECGTDICQPFTFRKQKGHLLWLAIRSDSKEVMRFLLQQPSISQEYLDEAFTSLSPYDFPSPDAMRSLIDNCVNVNKHPRAINLVIAAAHQGWEDLVTQLLKQGAKANASGGPMDLYRNVLEAAMQKAYASPSMVTLLVNHGAHVNSRSVTRAWGRTRYSGELPQWKRKDQDVTWEEALQLFLECKPDLNETWKTCSEDSAGGEETSALIEAVREGDLGQVRLLIEHGANASLRVGGAYDDALGCVFLETLKTWRTKDPYPIRPILDALVQGGASLENLEGDRLHIALAAAAFAGLEEMVQYFLDRGASPNVQCGHPCHTALGAAAAAYHCQAPEMVRMLLNSGPDVNAVYAFFQAARFALDLPFQLLISDIPCNKEIKDTYLRSAFMLISHGAIWDIDFKQWRNCLKWKALVFWHRNSQLMDQVQQLLERNRTSFLRKFPELASDEEWSIKYALAVPVGPHYHGILSLGPYRRDVLCLMSTFLE